MNIYINAFLSGENIKAVYLMSDIGTFYAEPVNDGVIGEGLLYNDYMFHFESDVDRTKIILKDSEKYITDAISGWLKKHSDITFISDSNTSLKALEGIANIDISDYHTTVIGGGDEELPVIEKTKKLKERFNR
jgi:hypothetical protein